MRVTAEPSLRLRSGPGTNYEAITSLATGVRLTITSIESNGWLGVETASGVEGYVHPDYVEVYTGGGGGGTATGATVSTNSLTLAQYQSARPPAWPMWATPCPMAATPRAPSSTAPAPAPPP